MRARNERFYSDEFSRTADRRGDGVSGSFYEDPWYYRTAESHRASPGMAWRDNRGKAPRNYKRSDQRIMDDIFEVVTADVLVDSSDVEINVTNGEVVLSGNVRDRRDKWRIEDLIERIPGVTNIENRIRVTAQQVRSTYNDNPENQGSSDTQLRSFVDNISSR